MAGSSDWSPAQHYRLSGAPMTEVSAPAPASVDERLAEVQVLHEARRERRRSRMRAAVWVSFVLCLLSVIAVCGLLLLGG